MAHGRRRALEQVDGFSCGVAKILSGQGLRIRKLGLRDVQLLHDPHVRGPDCQPHCEHCERCEH